jgi:hypothetical protein
MFLAIQEAINFMTNTIIKTSLTGMVLGAIIVFSQTSSNGQTNETSQTVILTANNSATNKQVWVTDEKYYRGDADTNGFTCVLWVGNHTPYAGQQHPICIVSVNSKSTNTFICWKAYPSSYLKIDLLDSSGKPVEKTEKGKQYGTLPDQKQLAELIKKQDEEHRSGLTRTDGFNLITPKYDERFTSFGLPELFELKQPGEYTLKVQIRLIRRERVGWDSSNPKLKITWLPEVIAKIQIRSEDVQKANQ